MESISYIRVGSSNHPIDAVTVNGLSFTSAEKSLWNNKQDALTFDSLPMEESENPVTSGGVYNMITTNEQVVAAAFNDLNERLLEIEDGSIITGISMNGASKGTSGNIDLGSVVTGISFNGSSVALSNGLASFGFSFDSIPTQNSDNLVKSGDLYTVIVDNEMVTATALNELNQRVVDLDEDMTESNLKLTGVETELDTVSDSVSDLEYLLDDLSDRVSTLEINISQINTSLTQVTACTDGFVYITVDPAADGYYTDVNRFNITTQEVANILHTTPAQLKLLFGGRYFGIVVAHSSYNSYYLPYSENWVTYDSSSNHYIFELGQPDTPGYLHLKLTHNDYGYEPNTGSWDILINAPD